MKLNVFVAALIAGVALQFTQQPAFAQVAQATAPTQGEIALARALLDESAAQKQAAADQAGAQEMTLASALAEVKALNDQLGTKVAELEALKANHVRLQELADKYKVGIDGALRTVEQLKKETEKERVRANKLEMALASAMAEIKRLKSEVTTATTPAAVKGVVTRMRKHSAAYYHELARLAACGLGEVNTRLVAVEKAVGVYNGADGKFKEIEDRLGVIEGRLTDLESRVGRLEVERQQRVWTDGDRDKRLATVEAAVDGLWENRTVFGTVGLAEEGALFMGIGAAAVHPGKIVSFGASGAVSEIFGHPSWKNGRGYRLDINLLTVLKVTEQIHLLGRVGYLNQGEDPPAVNGHGTLVAGGVLFKFGPVWFASEVGRQAFIPAGPFNTRVNPLFQFTIGLNLHRLGL